MYWNGVYHSRTAENLGLIETWDVLKFESFCSVPTNSAINRNLRCIEILEAGQGIQDGARLIETWDVLK